MVVGLACVAAPYLMLRGWGRVVDAGTLAIDLGQLVPFAGVTILRATGRLRARAAVVASAAVAAGTLAAQRLASLGADPADADATLWAPWLLLAAVVLAWALDRRLAAGRALRAASPEAVAGTACGAVLAIAGLRLLGAGELDALRNASVVFVSLAVEAVPFVLLGSLVSGLIQVCVPTRAFDRLARLPLAVQIPGAVAGGVAFPVCECGSVPVARGLMSRGLHPSAALSFMLSSPVMNPIVLGSTWIAFQGRQPGLMVAGRAAIGVAVAVLAGWALGRRALVATPRSGHDHDHHGGGGGRLGAVLGHLAGDFLFMGRFLVAGAALAALLQTIVPQSAFSGVLADPLVGIAVLMAAGYVLSLCSEADAFVAVSFTQFGAAAQIAFLTLGPALDLKLTMLYGASFGWRFVARLALVVVPAVFGGALLFGAVT
jgi:uncharacterized membrane protein YraQ (UPF0718 family)